MCCFYVAFLGFDAKFECKHMNVPLTSSSSLHPLSVLTAHHKLLPGLDPSREFEWEEEEEWRTCGMNHVWPAPRTCCVFFLSSSHHGAHWMKWPFMFGGRIICSYFTLTAKTGPPETQARRTELHWKSQSALAQVFPHGSCPGLWFYSIREYLPFTSCQRWCRAAVGRS